ncbi:MAG: hypothetical protein LBN27_03490 [Prevotellaceae bacterium]|nr:hypothetical protein [Prevotellaceae bacterium]
MLKKLYYFIKQLIMYPADTWKRVEAGGFCNNIHKDFVFPMVLAGTAAAAFGSFFTQEITVQNVVRTVVLVFLSYCGGFYAAVYLVKNYIARRFDNEASWNTVMHFTAYASTAVFTVNILMGVLPLEEMFFIRAFDIYTLFIVAQGAFILKISEKQQVEFVLITSSLIVFCPAIIKYVIHFLMPNL